MRVGFGYDVHAFAEGRDLVIGGVKIEGARGLAGWSDADALVHAVIDAMLGAAGMGDLGTHFPAEAVEEGVSSIELLRRTVLLIAEAGFGVHNVDATVIAQSVRLGSYRAEMEHNIAAAIEIDDVHVNVKATTTDRLGSIGRDEGVAAMAVVLLEPIEGGSD